MSSLQTIAQKYMNMLPLNEDGDFMDMPKFVMVNMLSAHWNGIAIWDGKECLIKVQKRVMKDEKTLDRIVAHEICHAWAYWMVSSGSKQAPWHRGHTTSGGWHEAAQRINRLVGDPEFVTEYSDETYVEQNEKKFWVYVEKIAGRGIMWAWFSRVTDTTARNLRSRISNAEVSNRQIAIFKTDDGRLLLPGAKLPSVARMRETPEDLDQKLQTILDRYPITQQSPRDIKTLVSQAKMARHVSQRPPLCFSR